MTTEWKGIQPASGEISTPVPRFGSLQLLLMTVWFGLLAGWLELGMIFGQWAIHTRISQSMIRTNRHQIWMVPASHLLVFGCVGIVMALLSRLLPGVARWIGLRLSIAMVCVTLLLDIEGLYLVACIVLAGGLATVIGRWIQARAEGFARLVRVSFPVMALGVVVLTGVTLVRVKTSEQRALAKCPPAKPGKPNVLLIVLDTVRASCLSLYGHDRRTTPNLERLAEKGIVFSEARSPAPWTSPTHASVFTGRWPHELSVAPDVALDAKYPTLAEVLGKQGYATAGFVGNVFYCNSLYGFDRGFARYEDAYENHTISLFETVWSTGLGKRVIEAFGYPVDLTDDGTTLVRKTGEMLNRDVLGWISERPAGQPFFAFVNYYDAHRPYVLHGTPEERFGKAALTTEERDAITQRFQDARAGKPVPEGYDLETIQNDSLELCHDSYDSGIAYLDRQVGLLVDEIERRGLLENTLVIVTSDHGEALGEHGLIIHGASLYSEEVHVPLVVIPPARSAQATTVFEPVSLRDIPTTIAEYVDLGAQSPFPGRSLTRFLTDEGELSSKGSTVLSELEHNIAFPPSEPIPAPFGPARSLVSGNLVYIRKGDGSEEVYNQANDPGNMVNLVNYPPLRPAIDQFRGELDEIYAKADSVTR